MQIGSHPLKNNLLLAPMAGITDRPFREICKRWGAGMTVSEMVSSKPELRNTRRSKLKTDQFETTAPRSVQIVGADPRQMGDAARYNADCGAQIIDVNMGCPAKKVCNVAAGSALMKDERLVAKILDTVVNAVNIPVTLKIRTGWDRVCRNAVAIAKIAESSGIQAITVHGRTRTCQYKGEAEYDTIKTVKRNITIPVIANGDIDSPEKAKFVLDYTGADGIMVGRGAQGRPWIFRSIAHFLNDGHHLPQPRITDVHATMIQHLMGLYELYGPTAGARIARKHIRWYLNQLPALTQTPISHLATDVGKKSRLCIPKMLFQVESPEQQLGMIDSVFDQYRIAA